MVFNSDGTDIYTVVTRNYDCLLYFSCIVKFRQKFRNLFTFRNDSENLRDTFKKKKIYLLIRNLSKIYLR